MVKNIEGQLIMSQQSLTEFFKSTNNKRKPVGPDADHKTIVTQKMQKYQKSKHNFPG